jgi:hypothetical protein
MDIPLPRILGARFFTLPAIAAAEPEAGIYFAKGGEDYVDKKIFSRPDDPGTTLGLQP